MLRYKGNGFIAGVPARDLTEAEVKKFGKDKLIQSGVYQEVRKPRPKKIDKPEKQAEVKYNARN